MPRASQHKALFGKADLRIKMKKYKPTSPGKRGMDKEDFSVLTKKKPERSLVLALKKRGGRAKSGRITSRHKGGGPRRLYRIVDFGQGKLDVQAKVIAIEYDPNRTGFIALLKYQDNEKRYILAPQGLKEGDRVLISDKTDIQAGNRMKLKNIPIGVAIYNIEIEPGRGGKLVRGAGTAAKILAKEGRFAQVEMPSREIRKIPQDCFASIGVVSRPEHKYIKLGKAGKVRWKGRRPRVRGSAMNPCDHPHGGGEGRSPIGLKHPKTPWGKPALGVKTRRRKWTDKYIIKRRRKKR